jgi:hypothetical protein
MEQCDRLGCPECQIETGDAIPLGLRTLQEELPRVWVPGIEHGSKGVLPHFTLEAEVGGAARHPIAGCLTRAEVVVLDAFGDGIQVVELATFAELADVEHLSPISLVVDFIGAL